MNWWPKKNVVVPVDFSDESFAAVDTALELVINPNCVCVPARFGRPVRV